MPEVRRLLILGGTGEARELADKAAAIPDLRVVTSLAGRTRSPRPLAGETRTGGFGGAEGLAAYLRAEPIDLVIDATHPFAAIISGNAAEACDARAVPRLVLSRPAWTETSGDTWIEAADVDAAAAALPAAGRRAFLTVGRNEIARFAGVTDCRFLIRVIDPPVEPLPFAGYTLIEGRPPFAEDRERALMTEHRIDVLVSKNSGGAATYAKIAAARVLGLPVLMIRRPPAPAGPRVETVAQALAWIAEALA